MKIVNLTGEGFYIRANNDEGFEWIDGSSDNRIVVETNTWNRGPLVGTPYSLMVEVTKIMSNFPWPEDDSIFVVPQGLKNHPDFQNRLDVYVLGRLESIYSPGKKVDAYAGLISAS